MTGPTMPDVVEALNVIYLDDGIAIWLGNIHGSGRFKGKRPIDVCRTPEGRQQVIDWAEANS